MVKMKELYEKVAADSTLQAKFTEIMKAAESAGEAATREKLMTFAKEAGYDVTIEEMQEFFNVLAESKNDGELSDVELDQVAGGKSTGSIIVSVVGIGICGSASILGKLTDQSCGSIIDGFFRE